MAIDMDTIACTELKSHRVETLGATRQTQVKAVQCL